MKLIIWGVATAILFNGCKQAQKVADVLTKPTPRELYARQFENDTSMYNAWENVFENALKDSVQIQLPYSESGVFFAENIEAYSYDLTLERGEIFHVEVLTDSIPVFIDVYKRTSDSTLTFSHFARNESGQNILNKTIEKTGSYKVILQAGIRSQANFDFDLYSTPSYSFPVLGKDNQAIQSFWGADREGGRRTHQGVDIFADRGTPVIAVTQGRVSSTGNRGLGGKQVWLKSGLLGNSLYYAHLDSVLVQTGKRVQIGDTLGLVGNTGNARTTAPHLHFGIYERFRGAIDPLPFIRINDRFKTDLEMLSLQSPKISVSAAMANLRQSPSVQSKKIGTVKRGDTLSILGVTDKWIHINTKRIGKAFVHKSLVNLESG
ncbi:hypothetical protein LCGC14_1021410 [marine sediment metagenome]